MSINLNELNEAYTLSKSVKVIINKMLCDSLCEDDASALYGLIHICESVIENQTLAINKLLSIEEK